MDVKKAVILAGGGYSNIYAIVLGITNVIAPTIAPMTTNNTSLLREKSILICSIFFLLFSFFIIFLQLYLLIGVLYRSLLMLRKIEIAISGTISIFLSYLVVLAALVLFFSCLSSK